MRRVSEDLQAIRKRLEELRLSDAANRQVVEELLNADLIKEFKRSIDEIRVFLWTNFQAAADQCGEGSDRSLQQLRLQRAAEMLRSVQEPVAAPVTPDQLEGESLFERLQNMADVAVERHMANSEETSGK